MDETERRAAVQDCRDLVIALVHCLDHGLARKAASLFAPDGVWVRSGKTHAGRAQIEASFDRPGIRVMRHLTMSTLIELAGDGSATGVSYYLTYRHVGDYGPAELPPLGQPTALGEWHDVFVKLPEGWRIAHHQAKRVFDPQPTAPAAV